MVVFRIAAAAALAVSVFPLAAQSLSPELRALEEQLPGTLVNDPSRIDWDSYGPEFYAESIKDDSIPGGGAARRFHVNQATEFIYTAGTNIPLIRNVKRGDTITIGFWARTVEAATPDGKGVLRVRFQEDSPPYPGFGEETLSIGTDWEWYEVSAIAEQALPRKIGIVALQFGRTKQVLEIGQAIVITGADSIVGKAVAAPQSQPVIEPPKSLVLPKPLQGLGTVLNDPFDRDWGFATSVESGSAEGRDDSTIWFGKATRLATTTGDPAAGVDALVSVNSAIAEGDNITIAVAAKSVEVGEDGKGSTLGLRFIAPAAGELMSESSIKLGGNWQLVRLVTKAKRDLRPGEAAVGLRIDGPAQGVDIGPVFVFKADPPAE